MSFSLSGSIITQTGTDTDLSGLSGIAGVTVFTPTDLDNPITYQLDGLQLRVQGNLSFNAGSGKLRYINMPATRSQLFVNGGTLDISASNNVGGQQNNYVSMLAIEFYEGNLSFGGYNSTNTPIYINNNATATLRGMYITPSTTSGGAIVLDTSGSTLTLEDATIVADASSNNSQLRIVDGICNLVRTTLYGLSYTLSGNGALNTFDDVLVRDNNECIVLNQGGLGQFNQLTNLSSLNAGTLIRLNNSFNSNVQHARLVNFSGGVSEFSYNNSQAGTVANRVAVTKQINLTPVNEDNASITAKYYAVDVNNGNRGASYTENTTGKFYDCANDIIYSGETSSDTIEVSIAFGNLDGSEDNRGLNSDGDIRFNWVSYNEGFSTATPSVLGTGAVNSSPILVTDSLISELSKAVVDAYTETSNAQRCYDKAKSHLVDNYAGETQTIVTRSGDVLDIRSYNAVMNVLAADVFAFDGSTVTFKMPNFASGLTGTGTLTLQNGIILNDGTFDTDIIIDNASDGNTYTGITASKIIHSGSGSRTLILDGSNVSEIEVTNGANLTVNLLNSATVTTTTETTGTITVNQTPTQLNFNNLSSSNVEIFDNSFVSQQRYTNLTGTQSYTIPTGTTGIWYYVINREGYTPIVTSFNTENVVLNIDSALTQVTQPSGTPMYTGSTSSLLNVEVIPATPRINLRIGNGTVSAQNIYDETEDVLMTSLGMQYLARGNNSLTIALLPTGTFIFMQNNVRLVRDSASDSSATVEAFATSTESIVLDNVNGGVQFVTVTRAQQLIEYGGHIYVDVNNGANESVYPFGTQANPVNSWDNAKALCDFYGIRDVKFTGTMLHTSDAVGYFIEGSDAGAIIVLQAHDISRSVFRNLIMTGDAGNPSEGVQLRESYADTVVNWNGVMDSVIFTGPVVVTGERNYMTRCSSAVVDDAVVVLTVNNNGQCTTSIRDWYGRLTIGGVSNALNTLSIDSDSGDIELLNTNTAGTITIRGEVTTFVDNSAGSTVNTAFVATSQEIRNLDLPALELQAIANQVRMELSVELARIDAAVSSRSVFNSSTDQVIVSTNNDKTGYSIAGTKTTLDTLQDISVSQVKGQSDQAIADANLATEGQLINVNENIKDASLKIPAGRNIND